MTDELARLCEIAARKIDPVAWEYYDADPARAYEVAPSLKKAGEVVPVLIAALSHPDAGGPSGGGWRLPKLPGAGLPEDVANLVKRLRDLSMSREDCGRAADALERLAKSLADIRSIIAEAVSGYKNMPIEYLQEVCADDAMERLQETIERTIGAARPRSAKEPQT